MITTISRLCKGRGVGAREVLEEAVKADITLSEVGDSGISLDVKCKYNCGGHGQSCRASDPEGSSNEFACAYALDLPYATDRYHGKRD